MQREDGVISAEDQRLYVASRMMNEILEIPFIQRYTWGTRRRLAEVLRPYVRFLSTRPYTCIYGKGLRERALIICSFGFYHYLYHPLYRMYRKLRGA